MTLDIQETLAGRVLENISNEDYHAGPGLSSSDLGDMADSFEFWRWRKGRKFEPTDDMEVGTATHYGVLEPHLFNKKVAFVPEGMRRDERTEKYKEFLAEHQGKIVLLAKHKELVERMIEAVLKRSDVMQYFTGGAAELSHYANYPGSEILVKCRPDYLIPRAGLSVNFKTARDASPYGFTNDVADRGYDWQSAFYLDILQLIYKRSFDEVHVVVEKAAEGPCQVQVYTIDDEDLDFARIQQRRILEKYLDCVATDTWPGRPTNIQSIKLPNFKRKVVLL